MTFTFYRNPDDIVLNNGSSLRYILYPHTYRLALDESLDSAKITIQNTQKDPFPQLSFIKAEEDTEEVIWWIVSGDTVTVKTVTPLTYVHEVDLIEPTKWLERFSVGVKTFTQPLVAPHVPISVDCMETNYLSIPPEVASFVSKIEEDNLSAANDTSVFYPERGGILPNGFLSSPIYYSPVNNSFPTVESLFEKMKSENPSVFENVPALAFSEKYSAISCNGSSLPPSGNYIFDDGKNDIWYFVAWTNTPTVVSVSYAFFHYQTYVYTYTDTTAKDLSVCANELLQSVEILQEGEATRFELTARAQQLLQSTKAPEMTFSGTTLREALDDIFGNVQAVTRLVVRQNTGRESPFFIDYDTLIPQGEEDMRAYDESLKGYTAANGLDDYATALDSTVENLVEYTDGGMVDPAPGMFRSLRTEDASYRVTETTGKILLAYPIEKLEKVEVFLQEENETFDITSFLYESTEYGILSSYDDLYPLTKAYALRYTFGSNVIDGFDFEIPNAVSQIFERPSIVNIINAVAGTNYSDLETLSFTSILFRVTYVPIVSARIRCRKEAGTESIIAYNQSASKVDSVSFGKNMFGALKRMGNGSIIREYFGGKKTPVPKCGRYLKGSDNVITAVTVQVLPYEKRVQLVLSKDFNRLSQYIGIKSYQRIFEVSERMAVDRNVIYEESISVGTERPSNIVGNSILSENSVLRVVSSYTTTNQSTNPITYAICQGFSENGLNFTKTVHPVITLGIGNAFAFVWHYYDNYSAGRNVSQVQGIIDGRTQLYSLSSDVPYSGETGRIDKLSFLLSSNTSPIGFSTSYETQRRVADEYPKYSKDISEANPFANTGDTKRIRIKKDSRERISVTYQINLFGRDGVVVSPQCASLSSIIGEQTVNGARRSFKFYLLSKAPNNLDVKLNSADVISSYDLGAGTETVGGINYYFLTPSGSLPVVSPAAWCIADSQGNIAFSKSGTMQAMPKIYFNAERKRV